MCHATLSNHGWQMSLYYDNMHIYYGNIHLCIHIYIYAHIYIYMCVLKSIILKQLSKLVA